MNITHAFARAVTTASISGLAVLGSVSVYAQQHGEWKLRVSPQQSQEAAKLGTADGAKAGGSATLPKKKRIGVILLSAQSAGTYRILNPVQELAKILDYDVVSCDPNFDAQKVAQCATSLVAQNVDAVFSISTSPGRLGSGLAEANAKGVKWFGVLSAAEPSAFMIPYGSPGFSSGRLSAQWMFDEAAARRGPNAKLKFALLTAPTVGVANLVEEQQVLGLAKNKANVEVVINHNLDLTNIVQDTLSRSRQAVQQHPDLAGIWTVCDLCVPLISQALNNADFDGGKRPIIAGNFSTAQSVSLLREGRVDMLMDMPFESSVWVAFDQLLAHWAKKTPVAASFDVFQTAYSLKFMEPYLLTKSNVGDSGPIPVLGPDYRSYFLSKWKVQYNLNHADVK